jgi:hypothetical protein
MSFPIKDKCIPSLSNNDGIEPFGKLLFDMKFMFFVISQMLPGIKIMFSSILPTLSWRYSEDLKAPDIPAHTSL